MPGCSYCFACGELQCRQSGGYWYKNVGAITCLSGPEKAWALLSMWQTHLTHGEAFFTWGSARSGPPACWCPPCLMLQRREGASPGAFPVCPSPHLSHTGRNGNTQTFAAHAHIDTLTLRLVKHPSTSKH